MSWGPSSREVLFRNPRPAGEPGHAAAGEEALERLLSGTDDEGFAGDRILVGHARAFLTAHLSGHPPTVGEAYRKRNADRVEVLFLEAVKNPRPIAGWKGSWEVGFLHAIEVTRANHLAFRTSLSLRRADAPGWVLSDPGDGPPIPRGTGRDALVAAQEWGLLRGLAQRDLWLRAFERVRARSVDPEEALKATALPLSVRERARPGSAARVRLGDVVLSLASVAATVDREEGECYARAAGRLVSERAAGMPAVTKPAARVGVERR